MAHYLTRFERWFLRRLFRLTIVQGYHVTNLPEIYGMIREAFDNQFTEDNRALRQAYLREIFEADAENCRL
jgi:hypothetical protein